MNCTRCAQPTDEGAAFCGNCGQALPAPFAPPAYKADKSVPAADVKTSDIESVKAVAVEKSEPKPEPQPKAGQKSQSKPEPPADIPSYAIADSAKQAGENKAVTALVLALLAIPAGLFIPGLGFLMAVVALVLGTMSHKLAKKIVGNTAIGFASLAILTSVAAFTYYAAHPYGPGSSKPRVVAGGKADADSQAKPAKAVKQGIITMQPVDTPCYRAELPKMTSFDAAEGSCTFKLYDGATVNSADTIYTIDAAINKNLTAANFMATIKPIAGQTVMSAAPGFKVTAEKSDTFAGSPSYVVDAKNELGDSVQMQMVFHPTAHGENVFVIVGGAKKGKTVDLSQFGIKWEWK